MVNIFGDILGYVEMQNCLIKNCCGYFLADFWKFWAAFLLTFGHTNLYEEVLNCLFTL